jgi:hypothetical protein
MLGAAILLSIGNVHQHIYVNERDKRIVNNGYLYKEEFAKADCVDDCPIKDLSIVRLVNKTHWWCFSMEAI